eukprot:gene12580-15804_t
MRASKYGELPTADDGAEMLGSASASGQLPSNDDGADMLGRTSASGQLPDSGGVEVEKLGSASAYVQLPSSKGDRADKMVCPSASGQIPSSEGVVVEKLGSASTYVQLPTYEGDEADKMVCPSASGQIPSSEGVVVEKLGRASAYVQLPTYEGDAADKMVCPSASGQVSSSEGDASKREGSTSASDQLPHHGGAIGDGAEAQGSLSASEQLPHQNDTRGDGAEAQGSLSASDQLPHQNDTRGDGAEAQGSLSASEQRPHHDGNRACPEPVDPLAELAITTCTADPPFCLVPHGQSPRAPTPVPLDDLADDLMGPFVTAPSLPELDASIGQHLEDLVPSTSQHQQYALPKPPKYSPPSRPTPPSPRAPPHPNEDALLCEGTEFYAMGDASGGEDDCCSPSKGGGSEQEGGLPAVLSSMPLNQQGRREPFLIITVRDPMKVASSSMFGAIMKGGHVTYSVSTATHLAGYRPMSQVRRRFNDFVALATTLKNRFRGYFIPPRPHKNFVPYEDMIEDFIEERRLGLEAYLHHLALHPVISQCEELRLFLEVDTDLSQNTRWAALSVACHLYGATSTEQHVLNIVRPPELEDDEAEDDQKDSFLQPNPATLQAEDDQKDSLLQPNPASLQVQLFWDEPPPPEEIDLRKYRTLLESFRDQVIVTVSGVADYVVHVLKTSAHVQMELAQAITNLATHEEESGMGFAHYCGAFKPSIFHEAVNGIGFANFCGAFKLSIFLLTDCKTFSLALTKISRICARAWNVGARHFVYISDYHVSLPAAIKALKQREKKLVYVQGVFSELESNNKDIRQLENSVRNGCLEYLHLKAVNEWERERYGSDMHHDFLTMLKKFAATMASSYKLQTREWMQLAEEYGASPGSYRVFETS